jgi:hypothetical protein
MAVRAHMSVFIYVPCILELLNYFETISATQERLSCYTAEKVHSCQISTNSGRSYIPTVHGGRTSLTAAWSYQCTTALIHGHYIRIYSDCLHTHTHARVCMLSAHWPA